jgi:signal-transduction protein with cAMP-binding, CBS, and nucleotidyltransferase domain
MLGQPPCECAFLALGSLARNEACPYSDLEFAVLISDISKNSKDRKDEIANIKNYFEKLTKLFEIMVLQLGETL